MEISDLPSHLPKQQLHKVFLAKDVSAGKLTAPRSLGIPILCSYSGRMRRSFKSCQYLSKDLSVSTYFDSEKYGPLQYSGKNTKLLATIRGPLEAQLKEEEETHNGSLKRFDSTLTATDEVEQVLHMVGGNGEISYAKNSRIQAKGILKAKPIVEEAVKEVYKTLIPKKFVAVDLACSSGPNTFLVISEITNVVDGLSRQSGLINSSEIQIFLNDLPGNDFNNIFRSLIAYEKHVKEEKGENFVPFYVAGSPGSFYRRLFPSKSVHFFHSSYGQMWLSKVPKELDDKNGDQLKKENLYLEQFKEDFSTFLKLRSEELIAGGRMVLTISGRRNNPKYKDMAYIWGLLTVALNDMISEGLLKEEDRNATNFPFYTPSMEEVKSIIEKEGSFYLDQMQTFELSWDPFEDDANSLESDYILRGEVVMKCIRAAAQPFLDRHFEKEIINGLFSRYAKIIATHLNEKPKWVSFILDLKLRG